MLKSILFVAMGGAIGSVLRYAAGKGISALLPGAAWPWGTFAVNIAGCFLIGYLFTFIHKNTLPDMARLFLVTGICGGFTTFSAFALENFILLKDGKTPLFLGYALGSLLLGLAATWAAYKLFS